MRLAPPLATLLGRGLLLVGLSGCAGAPSTPPRRPVAAVEPEPPEVVEVKPTFATSGWTRPAEAKAGCVARAVVAPADLKGRTEVNVKFAVGPDGHVDRFEDISTPPAPDSVVEAVSRAVRGCAFRPGVDPDQRPAYVWVLMTLQVGTPARHPEPVATAPEVDPKDVKVAPVNVSGDQAQPPPASKKKKIQSSRP
jgi:hypothetical protein